MENLKTVIEALRSNLLRFPPNDRNFISGLIQAANSPRGMTERQEYFLRLKHDRLKEILAESSRAQSTENLSFPKTLALLKKAAENRVQFPAIRLQAGDNRIVVSLRKSGKVYILDRDKRVERDGAPLKLCYAVLNDEAILCKMRGVSSSVFDEIAVALNQFEAHPEKASALSGHATGECCFCGRHLDTAASVAAGYGPICAEKFGLAWGDGDAKENIIRAVTLS